MRRSLIPIASIFLTLSSLAVAETTKTVTGTLPLPALGAFAIENLAGRMTVVPGDGDAVVATATIHAESASLASAMRFEQVRDKDGLPALRLIYPLDHERHLRYPLATDTVGESHRHGHGTVVKSDSETDHHGHSWFDFGFSGSSFEYDGHRVRVSEGSGALVYADIEVRVPKRAVEATFRNFVGALAAEGIEGRILLDTHRGSITARSLKGDIKADTGSSDVLAEKIAGSFVCDTGSGDCVIRGFEGRELSCDTGSGDVRVADVKAERLTADTGSGHIRAERADVEELIGDTGSGGIEAELVGSRLRHVKADTGSGDVTLWLPADASFDVEADQGSGDLRCAFSDAKEIRSDHKVVGYRRGSERTRILIDTGSGDAAIKPLR